MKILLPGIFFGKRQYLPFLSGIILISSCSGLFYQPASRQFYEPGQFGLTHELISFKNEKGTKLSGWFFETDVQNPRGIILQFHGNGENMSTHFLFLAWAVRKGYHLMTFDYSGYGDSEDLPSAENLRYDVIAAYNWLIKRENLSNLKITLYGQSLGAAVLVDAFPYLPQKSRIKAVVLESGFYSYQEIARQKIAEHWFSWPFQHLSYLLISDDYSPYENFEKIAPIPVLVIHGKKDAIIPFSHGEKIYQLCREPKTLWVIEDGTHISAMRSHSGIYREKLLNYLARY